MPKPIGWCSLSTTNESPTSRELPGPLLLQREDGSRVVVETSGRPLSELLLPNVERTNLGVILRRERLLKLLCESGGPALFQITTLRGCHIQEGDIVELSGEVKELSFIKEEKANREAAEQQVTAVEAKLIAAGPAAGQQLQEAIQRGGQLPQQERPRWVAWLEKMPWFWVGVVAIVLIDFLLRGFAMSHLFAFCELVSASFCVRGIKKSRGASRFDERKSRDSLLMWLVASVLSLAPLLYLSWLQASPQDQLAAIEALLSIQLPLMIASATVSAISGSPQTEEARLGVFLCFLCKGILYVVLL